MKFDILAFQELGAGIVTRGFSFINGEIIDNKELNIMFKEWHFCKFGKKWRKREMHESFNVFQEQFPDIVFICCECIVDAVSDLQLDPSIAIKAKDLHDAESLKIKYNANTQKRRAGL